MSGHKAWTDEDRQNLRQTLHELIQGEVRLLRRDPRDIVDFYREVYIEDEAPQDEWPQFVTYADRELARCVAAQNEEKGLWPDVTDCDRLDAAQEELQQRGILLWQASPCCDTCTGAELPDRIDFLEKSDPDVRERLRGYSFYIDQTLPELLAESREIQVYLAYG